MNERSTLCERHRVRWVAVLGDRRIVPNAAVGNACIISDMASATRSTANLDLEASSAALVVDDCRIDIEVRAKQPVKHTTDARKFSRVDPDGHLDLVSFLSPRSTRTLFLKVVECRACPGWVSSEFELRLNDLIRLAAARLSLKNRSRGRYALHTISFYELLSKTCVRIRAAAVKFP